MALELKKDIISILVVDDEESMRDLFERLFSDDGFSLDTVEDGAKAIEKVKAKDYDIAFIDIVMPGINGYLAFCEMKKISPALKAVMITGYSEESIIKACIKEGAYACLHKPFSLDILFSLIEKIKSERSN
jgi:DNA-binding NtrC family response regulator